MGDGEVLALADMESTLGYHPLFIGPLTEEVTTLRTVSGGQFDWGGRLPKCNGNRAKSVKAEGSLTASQTRRAGTKVGLSDPVVPSGRAIAQRIKATLGITG